MTFAEMKEETFRRLREVSSAPVFFSEADVEEALNAGYAELSDASEWYEVSQNIDILEDRPYYDLRRVLGAAFLAVGPGFDTQTSQWLLPTVTKQFDAHDRRWERVVGEPQRLIIKGLWWLGYWPRFGADSGTIKQYYTALPPVLAEDDDEPGFPENFHDGCIEFALADLWAQDAETTRALLAWAQYLETEAALSEWVSERGSGPTLHGFDILGGSAR